jgi:hypothetical protein
MRDLTEKEVREVSGGNPGVVAFLGVVSSYNTGYFIGNLANRYNTSAGRSFGGSIYYLLH